MELIALSDFKAEDTGKARLLIVKGNMAWEFKDFDSYIADDTLGWGARFGKLPGHLSRVNKEWEKPEEDVFFITTSPD